MVAGDSDSLLPGLRAALGLQFFGAQGMPLFTAVILFFISLFNRPSSLEHSTGRRRLTASVYTDPLTSPAHHGCKETPFYGQGNGAVERLSNLVQIHTANMWSLLLVTRTIS